MSINRTLLVLLGFLSSAAPALAQTSAACKPVTDAMLKVATTPHHTAAKTGTPDVMETIAIDNTTYLKLKGAWTKSPMTPQDQLKQEQENIKNAKVYTCQLLRTEAVNGMSTNVYKVHTETKDAGASDGTLWIAPSLGLPVRSELDLGSDGPKTHMTITWDFANIHAPAIK